MILKLVFTDLYHFLDFMCWSVSGKLASLFHWFIDYFYRFSWISVRTLTSSLINTDLLIPFYCLLHNFVVCSFILLCFWICLIPIFKENTYNVSSISIFLEDGLCHVNEFPSLPSLLRYVTIIIFESFNIFPWLF